MTAANPQNPDPNAIPGYVGQQVPSPPQAEYLPQQAMQQSWGQMPADAGMQAGFPQPGPGFYGPAVPARRPTSYKPAIIVLVTGLMFAVSPFLSWGVIDLITGNHGDGGDGLYWLSVAMLLYLTPPGIILILISVIIAIVIAVMNSSSKS